MRNGFYNHHFPTPTFLGMASVGVDISDRSIKYAELLHAGKNFRVGRFGKVSIPAGVIVSGTIQDSERLAEILAKMKTELHLDFVRVSLPEEQAYLFTHHVPKMDAEEIRNTLEFQLEKYVPIPLAEAVFDFDIIAETQDGFDIQVTVLDQTTINSYMNPFLEAGLRPTSLELEAQAIARTVIPHGDEGTHMIVDFGGTRTGISIATKGRVIFTVTVSIGGDVLTKIVTEGLGVSAKKAQQIKNKFGLKKTSENKKIVSALQEEVDVLVRAIQKHHQYWHTHSDDSGKKRPEIDSIILCGGNANMEGLSEYISTSVKAPIRVADAWINILGTGKKKRVPEIKKNESLGYVGALGLALADVLHD